MHAWLQRVWYERHWSGVLLLPLSVVFAIVSGLRRAFYRLGLFGQRGVGVPVLVIGNLTAGGSGKTPLVIWVVERLQILGLRPGVVSRGYGRDSRAVHQVADGDSVEEIGDEPVLIARRTGCPVVVGADRAAAARRLTARNVDFVVSDDGLQHYGLERDLEWVVIDGQRRFGNGRLLPAGPLRESPSRLKQVDAVVVNGEPVLAGEIAMRLIAKRAVRLIDHDSCELSDFTDRTVHAVAGIGNPQRFFDTLSEFGIAVIPHPFPDHASYSHGALSFDDEYPVLMTEKDAVKYVSLADERHFAVPVDASFSETDKALLLETIRKMVNRGR